MNDETNWKFWDIARERALKALGEIANCQMRARSLSPPDEPKEIIAIQIRAAMDEAIAVARVGEEKGETK